MSFAQAPQSFKYQAIARDVEGIIISNQNIGIRISILLGSAGGNALYTETHSVRSNQFGLINLEIGKGNIISGKISDISWGTNEYFVKIEMDVTGGDDYVIMGISQLLSVPYALYAERSGSDSKSNSDWYTMGFNTCLAGGFAKCGIGTTTPAGILDIAGEYHFPDIDGSNGQVLRTDGSGTIGWVNGGAGVLAENLAYLPSVNPTHLISDYHPYHYVYGYQGTDVDSAKATSNYQTYGVLYNWPAAMAGDASSDDYPGVQGVCPEGFYLPCHSAWEDLVDALGGYQFTGGKMKETDTIHWIPPNLGANNNSGFTGLPGGAVLNDVEGFAGIGEYGYFWSSTNANYDFESFVYWMSTYQHEMRMNNEGCDIGHSVRCFRGY